jgi:hypothetical protein
MPGGSLNFDVISAGASAKAGNWATAEAGAKLSLLAQAQLKRGVAVGAGAEAIVHVDASVQKYLAAGVNGQANAAARVQGQVQVPLDLFDECGLAVRLDAVAEAAAAADLRIGLAAEDFLALAGDGLLPQGAPMQLLRILLEEMVVQGGIQAKAAVAAMAYANVTVLGRLLKGPNGEDPGFSITAGYGAGWGAGAGFKVYAQFGVKDPRRLVRRSVDVAVDGTCDALNDLTLHAITPVIDELRTPSKIAFRTAFELGLTLAENGGAFSANDGEKVALRCVQVALEEVQRYVLERAAQFALDQLHLALKSTGFDNARWTRAQPKRKSLADHLRAMPQEPLGLDAAKLQYWMTVISKASDLALELTPGNKVSEDVSKACALLWSCIQLLSVSVQRISEAQARVSVLGAQPRVATSAFASTLPNAPSIVAARINAALGRTANAAIGQPEVIKFLTRTSALTALLDKDPSISRVLSIVSGGTVTSPSGALSLVFDNLGSFAPDASGRLSAAATLGVIRNGLDRFINERVTNEIRPLLTDIIGSDPNLLLYLDEVLISTTGYTSSTILSGVEQWASGSANSQKVLRETCSSILMRLFGRSLIVTADVLMTHTLENLSSGFTFLADQVNVKDGVAEVLAKATGIPRDEVAEVMSEALLTAGEAFEPMDAAKRAQIRDLLFRIIDTAPANGDGTLAEQLKQDNFVPNAEAALELAFVLGEEVAMRLVRFLQVALERLGSKILEEIKDLIAMVQRTVDAWVGATREAVAACAKRLLELIDEIARDAAKLEQASDQLLRKTADMLGVFAHSNRSTLKAEVKSLAQRRARAMLRDLPAYDMWPREAKNFAIARVNDLVTGVFNANVFDPVIDVLQGMSGALEDVLNDLADIEPGDDLASEVLDIFLDRLEDAVRGAFARSPRFTISISVLGVHYTLADIKVPLDDICSALRNAAKKVDALLDAVDVVAALLRDMLEATAGLQAAEAEQRVIASQKQRAEQDLASTSIGGLGCTIVQPVSASVAEGHATLEVILDHAPISFLGREAGEQRRFFVWLNHHEISLDTAVIEELGSSSLTIDIRDRIAVGGALDIKPVRLTGLHERTTGLAHRATELKPATSRSGKLQPRSTTFRSGSAAPIRERIDAIGMKPTGKLKDRPTEHRKGLRIRVELPHTFLVEGMNALVCALVPGVSAQRLEKSVSFLFVPRTERKPNRPIAPDRANWDTRLIGSNAIFSRAVLQHLDGHALQPAVRELMRVKPKKDAPPLPLFALAATRKDAKAASIKQLQAKADVPRAELVKFIDAVNKKALRPQPLKIEPLPIQPKHIIAGNDATVLATALATSGTAQPELLSSEVDKGAKKTRKITKNTTTKNSSAL